jgi:UDPglucose--hexose-1-phosphate uridylyltransferase
MTGEPPRTRSPVSPAATGPSLRRNDLSGKWTAITAARSVRPSDLGSSAAVCPFCEGNEALTPPELDAFRDDPTGRDLPGWRVRVVPNKYPALAPPQGRHEVIVHSPDHQLDLELLPFDRVADVVRMYQRRLAASEAAGDAAATIIVNRGREAGASLAHPHSQLFGLPIVPPLLAAELDSFATHDREQGSCLLCALWRAAGERFVFEDDLVAWTPDASRFGYELWLAPHEHQEGFGRAAAPVVARALQRALRALDAVTGSGALNYWLHTAPFGSCGPFHWHIEIAPKTAVLAGFELGTDITVNVVDPAEAAALLRGAL